MGRTSRKRRRKRCSSSQQDLGHERTYIKLLKWMHDLGFRGNSLKPTHFSSTGRGIAAGKTFKENDIIIAIPRTLLIGVHAALKSSSWLKIISDSGCRLIGMEILCTFLVEEKWKMKQGHASVWQPYISSLPIEFNHHIFWQSDLIKLLPCSIASRAIVQHQTVHDQFKSLKTVLNGLISIESYKFISINEYKWAWCCVNSRCVYSDHESFISEKMIIKSESSNYYLAPFLDLLNHSPNANVSGSYNHSTQCFEIKTHNVIHKHLQVMICYGHHSMCDLFLEYGFVVPFANPNDTYEASVNDLMIVTKKTSLLNKLEAKHLANIFADASISKGWFIDSQGVSFNLQCAVLMLGYIEQVLSETDDSLLKFTGRSQIEEKDDLRDFVQRIFAKKVDMHVRKRAETLLSSLLTSIENSFLPKYDKCLSMLGTKASEREKLTSVIRLYEIYIDLVSKSKSRGLFCSF